MTQTNDAFSGATPWHVPAGHPADTAELKRLVEERYSVKAEYAYTVPVRHLFGTVVWECAVHVFALADHPSATRAFAWSTQGDGATEHHVALESRAVPEAAEAVRLAIPSAER